MLIEKSIRMYGDSSPMKTPQNPNTIVAGATFGRMLIVPYVKLLSPISIVRVIRTKLSEKPFISSVAIAWSRRAHKMVLLPCSTSYRGSRFASSQASMRSFSATISPFDRLLVPITTRMDE